jgi:hypothetical protein
MHSELCPEPDNKRGEREREREKEKKKHTHTQIMPATIERIIDDEDKGLTRRGLATQRTKGQVRRLAS